MDNSGFVYPQSQELWGGLTKREEFAKAAMQGIIARDVRDRISVEIVAAWSVQYADALLAELGKEGE